MFFFHFQLKPSDRNKAYNKIMLYVVVSDFFVSIGTAFGIEKDNTIQCSIQAFLTTAFPLCSIFWTTVTFYLFYLAIRNRPSNKNIFLYLHCLCWGLPIILAVLPFSSGLRYGVKSGSNHEWCSFSNPNDVPSWRLTFWTFASFYFWVWLSVGGFSIIIGVIFYELNSRVFFSTDDANERLRPIVRKMIFLPMVIVLCWTIPTCYRIYYYINDENVYVLQFISAMSASLKGFITCVILLATNTVRMKFNLGEKDENDKSYSDYRGSESITRSASHLCRESSASIGSALQSPIHDHRGSVPDEEEEEDEDYFDRYLFRVPHDGERMSRDSRSSALSASSGV